MNIKLASPKTISLDTVVFPVLQGSPNAKILDAISQQTTIDKTQIQEAFTAEQGEILTLLYNGNKKAILLGFGTHPGFAEILKTIRTFTHKQDGKLQQHFGIDLSVLNLTDTQAIQWVDATANGLQLGTYQPPAYSPKGKTKQHSFNQNNGIEISILLPEAQLKQAENAITQGEAIGSSQKEIMHLVNAPANKKHPKDLAAWAQASGRKHGFDVTVFDKEKAKEIGLHGLLAVNRGSEEPAVFIIMEYKPKGVENVPKVGLVGKGVTFDTGGLSIKGSTNMHYMKSDMGGAAAVLGTMEATAKLQLPIHLIGIVPSTDNSVDALSIKPSDVIDSYSGKTIEIIDTDAEGRLILADGLAYMVKHFQPEVLIDLATLTGSAVRTFGYHAAALFTNNNQLEQGLRQAAQQTGERVWPLPIWDVYKEDLKSDVADVRNFSGRPIAGAIGAAKFLEVFTDSHPNWAHLDIAGVAFGDSEFTVQKSATGFGIRLLTTYFQQLLTSNT